MGIGAPFHKNNNVKFSLNNNIQQAGTGQHPEEEIWNDLEALSKVTAALCTLLNHLSLWTLFLHLEMRITPILAGETYLFFEMLIR